MSEQKITSINEIGEFGLINRLTKDFKLRNKTTILGVGDDAAVLRNEKECTVVSSDLMVEGVHFDLQYVPLQHLGYKAAVSNFSDMFAMNVKPNQILVSLAISSKYPVEAIEQIYEGISRACVNYGVDLVGGDTTSSVKGLLISITVIGQSLEENLTYRNTALEGDVICVSGDLGGAYMGLQVLEREKSVFQEDPNIQPVLQPYEYVVGRQLKPEAREDVIDLFEKFNAKPSAMIDISDGLSSDLMHICKQSDVGASIRENQIPIHENTTSTALEMKISPTTCALNGGEDFELLFTMHPREFEKISELPIINQIGIIKNKTFGISLDSTDGNQHALTAQGWNHFKN